MAFLNDSSIVIWPIDDLGPEAISCLFSPLGEIKHLHLEIDEDGHTGAWVCFYGGNPVLKSIEKFNGQIVDGKIINVERAKNFIRKFQDKKKKTQNFQNDSASDDSIINDDDIQNPSLKNSQKDLKNVNEQSDSSSSSGYHHFNVHHHVDHHSHYHSGHYRHHHHHHH